MSVVRTSSLGLLALILTAPALASAGGGVAVEGHDRTRLLPPSGARVLAYRNAGYELTWRGDEVEVAVDLEPLRSTVEFELPALRDGLVADPVERLARALTAGADQRYLAVSRVLGWVARHIEYDLDRRQPQTAASVLARRSGYCTGVARLTVALLASVDIPAREVAGYVVDAGEPGQPAGYHRWIEVHFPDRGWVFSDPLASHHYVPATYVRLAGEDLELAKGLDGLLLARDSQLIPVDVYPPAMAGVSARRNRARQLAGALRVRVEEGAGGTAVLEGGKLRRTQTLRAGETTFLGLRPGPYRLRLELADRVLEGSIRMVGGRHEIFSVPSGREPEWSPSGLLPSGRIPLGRRPSERAQSGRTSFAREGSEKW